MNVQTITSIDTIAPVIIIEENLNPFTPPVSIVVDMSRLRRDADIIDQAGQTTRSLINDIRAANGAECDVPAYLIKLSADNGQWLAARRGTPDQKRALFGAFASHNIAPRGLSNSLKDLVALSSDCVISDTLRTKYAELLKLARLVNAVSKMIADDKKEVHKDKDSVFAAEDAAASKRKEDRETEKQQATASALLIAEGEQVRQALEAWKALAADILAKREKITKAQIISALEAMVAPKTTEDTPSQVETVETVETIA